MNPKALALVIASPLLVTLVLALLTSFGSFYHLLDPVHETRTTLLLFASLLGLTIYAGVASTDATASNAYAVSPVDAGVFSLAVLAAVQALAWRRPRLSSPALTHARGTIVASAAGAVASAAYALIKIGFGTNPPAGVTPPPVEPLSWVARMGTGPGAALLALAVAAPLVQCAVITRLWRRASPAELIRYEQALFSKSIRTPFVTADAVGIHATLFKAEGAAGVGAPPGTPVSEGTDPSGTVTTRLIPSSPTAAAASSSTSPLPPIVILHGYMSGAGMHVENVDDYTAAGYDVYLVDWLGCGGSARPAFTPRTPAETASWFLDAFEAWRAARGIERMVLFGHSMGGWLVSHYALAHPQRIAHLLLVSPAAMPVAADTDGLNRPRPAGAPQPPRIPPTLRRVIGFFWNRNATPGALLRLFGPLGRWCATRGIKGRVSRLILKRPLAVAELGEYFYHNLGSDGSGEWALNRIFAPGAYGRDPAAPKLIAAAATLPPVSFFYGAYDWMSQSAGQQVAAAVNGAGGRATVHVVPEGGHHLYLENPEHFNACVLRDLSATFGTPAEAVKVPSSSSSSPAAGTSTKEE